MDSGANNSGPDDTDNGGCERDWGFETHSRRTFTRVSHSEASESALGEVDDTDRHPTTDTVDDHHRDSQMAGGRTLSFSHYTTEGIFIHGGPAFRPSLEPPKRLSESPKRETMLWSGSFP